jgi:hypothetical protein
MFPCASLRQARAYKCVRFRSILEKTLSRLHEVSHTELATETISAEESLVAATSERRTEFNDQAFGGRASVA